MVRIQYPKTNCIVYLEAHINYTIFHLKNGSRVLSSFTLKRHQETEKLASFLRINRGCLLNPDFIEKIEHHGQALSVKLKNNLEIRVSRRRTKVLEGLLSVNGFEHQNLTHFVEH